MEQLITTAVEGRAFYVYLNGQQIGAACLYRGKSVLVNGVVTSQKKAAKHFVSLHKQRAKELRASGGAE